MGALHAVLAPPPLSPLFRHGGALAALNEDVTLIAFFTATLWLLDVAVVRRIVHPKGRYFALHTVANAVSAVASSPDVLGVLTDPLNAMSGPSYSMVANSAVVALHLYHCLAFKLRAEDIFHHAMFTLILCGLAIPFKQTGGAANNFGCFFLSGLPGGIDYGLLVLVKQGILHPLEEKRYNSTINSTLRMPAMIVYGWVMYTAWLYDRLDPSMADLYYLPCFIAAALHVHNGVYYGTQAIENYATRSALASVAKPAASEAPKGDDSRTKGGARRRTPSSTR